MTKPETDELIAALRRWLWWRVGYEAGRDGAPSVTWGEAEALDLDLGYLPSWPTSQRGAHLARWVLRALPDFADRGAREGWRELRRRAWCYCDSGGKAGSRWCAQIVTAMAEEDRPIEGAYFYQPRSPRALALRDRLEARRRCA